MYGRGVLLRTHGRVSTDPKLEVCCPAGMGIWTEPDDQEVNRSLERDISGTLLTVIL